MPAWWGASPQTHRFTPEWAGRKLDMEQGDFDSLVRSQVAVEVNVTRSSIAASYITNLQKLSSSIRKNVDKIKLPMIVLQGSNDHLVSAKAAEHLTKKATSSPHRQWHLYPGRSHCALHDTNKEDVWRDIISWLGTMTSINH